MENCTVVGSQAKNKLGYYYKLAKNLPYTSIYTIIQARKKYTLGKRLCKPRVTKTAQENPEEKYTYLPTTTQILIIIYIPMQVKLYPHKKKLLRPIWVGT